MNNKKHLITAALPYANGCLHLGHLAGVYIPADIYSRFLRLLGEDVIFVSGSDEYGTAISIKAKKENITPQQVIDKYHKINKETFEKIGISFDCYYRTSEDLHKETAQEFFLNLLGKKEFEVNESEQFFDETFNQFLADRFIKGTCNHCGFEEANGDQCEKCGTSLKEGDLINPKSVLSGEKPILKLTKHWYFKLQNHTDWLKDWIQNSKDWKKQVVGECLSWLNKGLNSRSITRDLDWGIDVPLTEAEGKKLYVWFDAPIGYISATKDYCSKNNKDWKSYWKNENSELIHFIGKDNIVFHTIIFPAMLKAYGGFNLPKNVPANQYYNLEGNKFSKSKGNVIEQHQYLETFKDFLNKEDALRFVIAKTLPENSDGDFKWDDFVNFYDGELVDVVGNFINRSLSLFHKNFGNKVFDWDKEVYFKNLNPLEKINSENFLKDFIIPQINSIIEQIKKFEFRKALQSVLEIARWGNILLQNNEPWKDINNSKEILCIVLQITALLSVVLNPFIPFTTKNLREILNLSELKNGDLVNILKDFENGIWILKPTHLLNETKILFQKIKDKKNTQIIDLVNIEKTKLKKQ